MTFNPSRFTQYASAVLLIVSSIALAWYSTIDNDDIAQGVLLYIAQAFLLAGSIFGLDYYVKKLTHIISNGTNKTHEDNPPGDTQQ